MNLVAALAIGGLGTLLVLFILIYAFKKHPPKENACDCSNPQWCDKWCCAKENFTKAHPTIPEQNYSIKEECKHPHQLTRVLESSGTCETTIEVCEEPLTAPITDCR
jgi:hypothetical protein